MSKNDIKVGTEFYHNDETERIYEKYKDFFDVKEEYGLKYILIKEPSPELVKEIEAYFMLRKEWNRKYKEFVTNTAKDIIKNMSEEDKAYIYDHPSPVGQHFGRGLGIRNEYIHGKDFDFPIGHPDSLSSNITSRIASLIIDNYDYNKKYYRALYDNHVFCHFRLLYKAITGDYPDQIVKKYENNDDYYVGIKQADKEVKSVVVNARRFKRLCKKYGISDDRYKEFKQIVDDYNKEHWDIVPYDIALLESYNLEPAVRTQLLEVLKVVVNKMNYFEIPEYVFYQKDAALVAVNGSGSRLEQCKKYSNDPEVIITALTKDARAIQYVDESVRYKDEYLKLALSNDIYGEVLALDCMADYRDNDEYVLIALEANGASIQWASDRIRDDFDMAAFAIRHQNNCYYHATVNNLSERLRDNIELAIIDLNEGHACVEDFSDRVRDNDEVAKAILASDNSRKICEMSDRIRKIYDKKYNK